MANLAAMPSAGNRPRLVEAPMPSDPAPHEVRVRMSYAPLNPADLLAIDGRYSFELAAGVPLGAEGSGIVEVTGQEVRDLEPGDPVMLLSRGNWCRYRTVPRSEVIVLPAGADMVQAAMLRINPPTAKLLLAAAGTGAGDVIVQNAATSSVATWVRMLAAQVGVTVIDVVRRPDPALPGAIVDGEDLADRVKDLAADRPVCAALDCVAGSATERMARCLGAGGRVVLFGHMSGEPIQVRSQLLTGGGLTITGFSLRPAEAALGPRRVGDMFEELLSLKDRTGLELPVRAILPLARADDAIALAREGGRGRVLLHLAD